MESLENIESTKFISCFDPCGVRNLNVLVFFVLPENGRGLNLGKFWSTDSEVGTEGTSLVGELCFTGLNLEMEFREEVVVVVGVGVGVETGVGVDGGSTGLTSSGLGSGFVSTFDSELICFFNRIGERIF